MNGEGSPPIPRTPLSSAIRRNKLSDVFRVGGSVPERLANGRSTANNCISVTVGISNPCRYGATAASPAHGPYAVSGDRA